MSETRLFEDFFRNTSSIAIISSSNYEIEGKKEEYKRSERLLNDLKKLRITTILSLFGHFNYDTVSLNQFSFLIAGKFNFKDILKLARKYNQNSFIFNKSLYDTKTGKEIKMFSSIKIGNPNEFSKYEDYSKIYDIKDLCFELI
jgi:hypothetical protein